MRACSLLAVLLVLVLGACRSGTVEVRSPVHPVGHTPEICDLCDLYDMAQNWVVRIRTKNSLGSGVVFSEDGLIVTNAHVVRGNETVLVQAYDGAECTGTVVAADEAHDLALIRTEGEDKVWRVVPVRETEMPRVGSEVYVIGHPLGLGWSITRGIVSAHRSQEGNEVIQTDAAISPGNSGGPLLDGHGHVLGIVTSKALGGGAENIAFVQPLDAVLRFLEAAATTPPDSPR